MIIAIDLDGVIADSLGKFIEFHNDVFNTSLKVADFTSYTLNESIGMPRKEEIKHIEMFDDSNYFNEIKPLKEAPSAILDLSSSHKLAIVTGRNEGQKEKTLLWIKKYVPQIKEIFFIRKSVRDNSKSKAEICKEIQADILIEDNLKYAQQVAQAGIKVLLFDYPWNQSSNLNPLIIRVCGWKEALNFINSLKIK